MIVIMKNPKSDNAIVCFKEVLDKGYTELVIIDASITSRTRYLERKDVAHMMQVCKQIGARVTVCKE